MIDAQLAEIPIPGLIQPEIPEIPNQSVTVPPIEAIIQNGEEIQAPVAAGEQTPTLPDSNCIY